MPHASIIYDLAAALSIIESEGPSQGLLLNRAKSLIFAPTNVPITHPLLRDIPSTSIGFKLLGSPIGPSSFCESTISNLIDKIQQILSHVRDLEDSQMEVTLLRSCLALPKFSHVLRTCPPTLIPNALEAFDSLMRNTLSDLAGGPLPDWSWLKASLPSSLGGLNIRLASLHAPAAYIGSFQQCRPLVADIIRHAAQQPAHFPHAIRALAVAVARPDWSSIDDIDVSLTQRHLSHAHR